MKYTDMLPMPIKTSWICLEFDNNVIFIDNGPVPPKPKKKILRIEGKMVPCINNCSYCKYYCEV